MSTLLTQDATTVVGLAGTALAFTDSVDDEAERWLTTLRLYGEVGVLLHALGVDEESRAANGEAPGGEHPDPRSPEERLAAVLSAASEFAARRSARAVGTIELLLAVLQAYGDSFDRALERRGIDRIELVERAGSASAGRAESPSGAGAA